ncbi:MAG: tandem-95 repeat protein [Actinomycetia bacterium]|nr:tandem-95 repeat protein [Actinomycetes bacterium]
MTRGHAERVRAYSATIGEEMGLRDQELELLNWSGLIHDIGKLTVSAEILNKPGELTDAEWVILRQHPLNADELVAPLRSWLGDWVESATQHHEWFDGGGYPNGLAGDEITMAGRIVAVADAYDVMTSIRSYKSPMSAVEARRELARCAGTQFDPAVVRAFLNVAIGRLRLIMGPLSSLVQLPAGSASLGSAGLTGASALASVAAASIIGLGGPPPEPIPETVAFDPPEAVDVVVDTSEDTDLITDIARLMPDEILTIELIDHPDHGTTTLVDGVVTFTPDPDFNGTVEVPYRVCFVDTTCDEGVVTIVVVGTNDDPVAVPDRVSLDEDTSATVDVIKNDSDIDGDDLAIVAATIVDRPDHSLTGGEVTVTIENGRIGVTPAPERWGTALIEYTITDPNGATAGSTLAVEVTPVDDPPVAVNDTLTAYENTPADLDVLANDSDIDGDPLTIVSLTDVVGGTATTDGATVTFIPSPRYFGPAALTYTISDGTTSAQAIVDLTVIDITSIPPLEPDSASTNEDQAITIDILANDFASSLIIDPTTVVVIDPPDNGQASWNGSTLEYTPDPDFAGEDRLQYFVCDLLDFCNAATVTVTVAPVNDVPVFVAGVDQIVVEDAGPQAVAGWASGISAGPGESGQIVTFGVITTNPSLFSAPPVVDSAGQLSYTPAPDANGTATITVTLSDNGGTTNGGTDISPPAVATITITPVNDDPVAVDDGSSLVEDNTLGVTFDVLTNDSDIDGDTPQYGSANTSTVVNGIITDNLDGTFTYVPDEHFHGTETFTYTTIDGNAGTDSATVNITITPVPDTPVASDDARVTPVDTLLVVPAPGLLVNDYDVDIETLTVTTTPITPPSNGVVVLGADGSYTYTPGSGYVGTDSFVYEISDPGGLTATATVTITVDSGVTNRVYYLGDSGSAAWDYDLVTSAPPSSAPVFDSDTDGDPGLTIEFGSGLDSETDTDVYQLWTLTAASPVAMDGPVTLDLWATVENFTLNEKSHPHVYLYDCLAASCTFLTHGDIHVGDWNQGVSDFVNLQIELGSVTHTVATGRDLVLRLQFKHEDMWVAMTADYPSALNLTLANQAPVAADDTSTVNEDSGTTNLSVLANDVDTDIDPASVAVTAPAGSGTATPVGDGTIDYTPDPETNGVDTFAYQVCDLGGNCDTATVTVTVTPVNDEPSFTGGGAVAAGLGPSTLPAWATGISAGPADESGQLLTFVITANDNPGLFTTGPAIDATSGDLSFDVASTGVANVTIQLVDNGGTANGGDDTSPTYNFTITIS